MTKPIITKENQRKPKIEAPAQDPPRIGFFGFFGFAYVLWLFCSLSLADSASQPVSVSACIDEQS